MQLYNPIHLVLLWLIPLILIFLYITSKRKKRIMGHFAQPETFNKISLNYSKTKFKQRVFLYVLAVVLIVIALAQPQWGKEKRKFSRKGVDIMFLLDTSRSMLVEDIKPNRIEKAKLQIHSIIKKLKGDRVGLVVFAGDSFLKCPLTLDYSAFRLFLDSVNVDFFQDKGTDLMQAILTGISSFKESDEKYNVMIIFSDGEDHVGKIDENLNKVKKLGIRIYAVGMGTSDGGPIPLKNKRGVLAGYKKDNDGNLIFSRLEEKNLFQIANMTDGLYYQATTSDKELDVVMNHIEKIDKREFEEKMVVEKEDHFQIFILLAFVILVIELMIGERKRIKKIQV